jgi:predicted nuclease with TOPRIM domain
VASKQAPTTSYVPSIRQEKVNEVLSEVSQLKDKQEDMDTKLETMKKENEALWREVVSLRQKHVSQQKIVNKLIQVSEFTSLRFGRKSLLTNCYHSFYGKMSLNSE